MGSLSWGMLQHPHLHGAHFGDVDRLVMSRVVPTILLARDAVEGETLGRELTFVAAVCTQGCSESVSSTPAGSGVTHTLQGRALGSTPGWFFSFPSSHRQRGSLEGKDCLLFFAEGWEVAMGMTHPSSGSLLLSAAPTQEGDGSPPSSSGEQWSCRSCSLCSRGLSEMPSGGAGWDSGVAP